MVLDSLLADHPELDIEEKVADSVVEAISKLVGNLKTWGSVRQYIDELCWRHARMGVNYTQFQYFGDAIIKMVSKSLKPEHAQVDVLQYWSEFVNALCSDLSRAQLNAEGILSVLDSSSRMSSVTRQSAKMKQNLEDPSSEIRISIENFRD